MVEEKGIKQYKINRICNWNREQYEVKLIARNNDISHQRSIEVPKHLITEFEAEGETKHLLDMPASFFTTSSSRLCTDVENL